ncbi:MAG: nucleotidyltransferase family protein [Elusimicrobiota bacterium]|jgi:NDP-sugar pyrophosphorylase family protein
MVLAAGEGRRLRPLTERTPKALVEAGGKTMLERVLLRLKAVGVREVVVNLWHLGAQVEDYLRAHDGFGLRVAFSREERLLDTGGGLKNAGSFFDDGKPFFLHNVDICTDSDLGAMLRAHEASGALSTLAVRSRPSSRYLLFDRDGRLRGRDAPAEGGIQWAGAPAEGVERLAFDGVHVISPRLFARMSEEGVFSINQTYLRLAGEGEVLRAFRSDGSFWAGIDTPERLERLRKHLSETGGA